MIKRFVVVSALALVAACSPYYTISQKKNVTPRKIDISKYRKAAVVMETKSKKNKLFLEALNVTLMRRGLEVVEREKLYKLLEEQLLAKGNLANLSDRERAMRIGKLLDVDVILYADAIMNQKYYVYEPDGLFPADPQVALRWQADANSAGILRGIGKGVKIRAYYDVGVTMRAIDTATGEIAWVGYRVVASHQEVTKDNMEAWNNFSTVRRVCELIADDFLGHR